MNELEELEQETLDEQLLDVQPVPDTLPAVPQAEPQKPRPGEWPLPSG